MNFGPAVHVLDVCYKKIQAQTWRQNSNKFANVLTLCQKNMESIAQSQKWLVAIQIAGCQVTLLDFYQFFVIFLTNHFSMQWCKTFRHVVEPQLSLCYQHELIKRERINVAISRNACLALELRCMDPPMWVFFRLRMRRLMAMFK